jgi:glycosyltransferase involved in cell wall biosynthesis
LRVALVTGSYNYIRDGVALTLNRLVAYLLAHNVEVKIFAPVGKHPALEHAGDLCPVPSFAIPLRPEYRLARGLPRAQRDQLIAFAPDILHLATPDFMGHRAQKLGRDRAWPIVASYHTRYDTYLKYYHLDWLQGVAKRVERDFYDACLEVFVPSQSMAEALIADGVTTTLRLWPRGVDTRRFDPAKRSGDWRARRGLAEDELAIAFVSRLVKEKRLDDFVAVVTRLKARGVKCRALIVGDGPERQSLAQRLPDGIFEGFVVGEDLAIAYASADMFVFPSDTETFGSVTLEAMASGLPAICADATGSQSLVVSGVTGFLAPVGDSEAMAEAALTLARDPGLRRRMSVAARAHSLTFSWDEAMAGVLARYRSLAQASPKMRAAAT